MLLDQKLNQGKINYSLLRTATERNLKNRAINICWKSVTGAIRLHPIDRSTK